MVSDSAGIPQIGDEMAAISRVRAQFTGFAGAPGVSTFYCLDPVGFVPLLRAYLQNSAGRIPANVDIQVQNSGDVIDSVSGVLGATWTVAPVLPIYGAGTGVWASPVGSVVNWLTGSVVDGRRLRGKTFMVPLVASVFDLTGSLNATVLATMRTEAADFVVAAANNFVVWHRPRPATALKPYRSGGHAIVTSSVVPDKACILRSRRD